MFTSGEDGCWFGTSGIVDLILYGASVGIQLEVLNLKLVVEVRLAAACYASQASLADGGVSIDGHADTIGWVAAAAEAIRTGVRGWTDVLEPLTVGEV